MELDSTGDSAPRGYRSKSGITRRFRQQKQQHQITEIESTLPTAKTTSSSGFLVAAKYIVTNFTKLEEFYSMTDWAKNRLLGYSGRQKMYSEIVKIFVNGGRKYNHKAIAQKRTSSYRNRFRRQAFSTTTKIPPLAVGDGSFPMTLRGTLPGFVMRLRRILKKAESDYKLVMVSINEAYTSKVCSRCHTKNMVNKVLDDDDTRLHSVLVCSDCKTTWNRDVNAANNIYHLARCQNEGVERPAIFSRPTIATSTTAMVRQN